MRTAALVLAATLMTITAACSTQRPVPPTDETVADYIEVSQLETVDGIRTYERDGVQYINDRYIIFKTRDGYYLFEFQRSCRELRDDTRITPDIRRDARNIRARFDTLRGCVIGKIYPITEAQRVEIKALGEAPGQRN